MKVKLTVVDGKTNGNLPVISVEGETEVLPSVGKRFSMKSNVLGLEITRYVTTSKVTETDVLDDILTFCTEEGSIYTLEILGQDS